MRARGQPQELVSGPLVVEEDTAHGRSDRLGVLLLNAPHHHAQVIGLDDDAHPQRLRRVPYRLGDLLGESLLNLEPAGEHLDHASRLG